MRPPLHEGQALEMTSHSYFVSSNTACLPFGFSRRQGQAPWAPGTQHTFPLIGTDQMAHRQVGPQPRGPYLRRMLTLSEPTQASPELLGCGAQRPLTSPA